MATLEGLYRTDFPQRLLDRVAAYVVDLRDLHGNDACWPWPLSCNGNGYGQIGTYDASVGKPRNCLAHRLAWVVAGRELPSYMTIDHLCKNRACVNVRHLRLLTLADNARNGRWGTPIRGEDPALWFPDGGES